MKNTLIGQRFSRLIVISEAQKSKSSRRYLCRCDCGIEKVIISASLIRGYTRSCGCLRVEATSQRRKIYGNYIGPLSRELLSWKNAKQRCFNPNNDKWVNYGGRGITMCVRWANNFENFLADMGTCPPDYTLERKNVNLGYEPSNCVWLHKAQQAANRTTSVRVEYEGAEYCLKHLAAHLEISYRKLRRYYRRDGLSLADAIKKAQS